MLRSASWALPAAPPSLQKVALVNESLHISLNTASAKDRFWFPFQGAVLWGMIHGQTALCPKCWAKGSLSKVWEPHQGTEAHLWGHRVVFMPHPGRFPSPPPPQVNPPHWEAHRWRLLSSQLVSKLLEGSERPALPGVTLPCQRLQWVNDKLMLVCTVGLCCRSIWLPTLLSCRMITLPGVGRRELGSGVYKTDKQSFVLRGQMKIVTHTNILKRVFGEGRGQAVHYFHRGRRKEGNLQNIFIAGISSWAILCDF